MQQRKRINMSTAREEVRRLGIILTAAGLLAGVFEGAPSWQVVVAIGAGLVLLWYGNLEDLT